MSRSEWSVAAKTAALAVVFAFVVVVAGCGAGPLRVSARIRALPERRQLAMSFTASGRGQAVAGLVLTTPDGRSTQMTDALVGSHGGGDTTLDDFSCRHL